MNKKLLVHFALVGLVALPVVVYAQSWAEPDCNPATDPASCNVSAPLNVSSSGQTKAGPLTITGALTGGSTLTIADTSVLSTLVVNGTNSTFNSPAIFNSSFTYTGNAANFVISADTIIDADVSNTLTSSNYVGTGSTTNAVDLATAEVAGQLPASAVKEEWVNVIGDNMTGALIITPSSAVDGLTINPNSTQEAIYINGITGQPLVNLYQSGGTGPGLSVTMNAGTSGRGLNVYVDPASGSKAVYLESDSTTSAAYVLDVRSDGSSARTINVTNVTASGYGILASASGATSTAIRGSGTSYGVFGYASDSGTAAGVYGAGNQAYGGYFSSAGTSATTLYAELTSAATTTSSKAIYGAGKNGYGGYFTANGDTSTALYAENTSTNYYTTKYGIQAIATTPQGVGIYAVSDYGRAGHFESNSGGTAVYVDGTGATYGIELDASGGTAGIDVDTTNNTTGISIDVQDATGLVVNADSASIGATGISVTSEEVGVESTLTSGGAAAFYAITSVYDTAFNTETGIVSSTIGFNGGQFYPNENAGNGVNRNGSFQLTNMGTVGYKETAVDMLYDGSQVWMLGYSGFYTTNLYRFDATTGQELHATDTGSLFYQSMVRVDDEIYAFSSNSDDVFIEDIYDGTTRTDTTGSTHDPNCVTTDGDDSDIWIGTNDNVEEWISTVSAPSARVSGTGAINDIIYADGYVWASDGTNDRVYKIMEDSPYTSTTITVGDNPQGLVYDGDSIWVANYTDSTLTRIDPETDSTSTYEVTAIGTGPTHLEYDGANIWIAFNDSNEISYFNIASEAMTDEYESVGYDTESMIFDGTHLWMGEAATSSTDYGDINMVFTGTGFGSGTPTIKNGLLIYNTSGDVYCLSVSSTGGVSASSTLTNCQ